MLRLFGCTSCSPAAVAVAAMAPFGTAFLAVAVEGSSESHQTQRGRLDFCNNQKIVTIFHKHLENKMHLKISNNKKPCMLFLRFLSNMFILTQN